MRIWLLVVVATMGVACLTLGPTPALAAAANDAYADAAAVESLPYADSRDMGGAGAEASETAGSCARPRLPRNWVPTAPFKSPSVWYRFEPADDLQITIDTSASDFAPMVTIYNGDDLVTQQEVACRSDGALTADLRGGASYAIQVLHPGGDGSNLQLAIERSELPGVADIRPFEVAADDGTPLRGHVYLPEGEGPFAPVLEYSPYWNTAYGPSESFTEPQGDRLTLAAWLGPLMDAGFAVALVNMRGSGESGGCMQWGGPIDRADTAVVVEALADAEWSTGKVGMYGLSYPGWTQMLALASDAAPSLKAVVPASPVTDWWSLHTGHGATFEMAQVRPSVFTAQATTGTFNPNFRQTDTPFVPDTGPGHFTCQRYSEEVEYSPPAWNGDRTDYWRERDLRSRIERTDVAVFATVGLLWSRGQIGGQDWDPHISQLDGIWERLGGARRFMLGQWGHAFPTRLGFHRMAVAWLDQHLRNGSLAGAEDVESGVVEYQDDSQVWHTAGEWPPPADETKLWLSGDDLVVGRSNVEPSSRSFLSTDQVPCAGRCVRPLAARVPDCSLEDELVYVSEPLAEEVVIAGHYKVDLTVESTLPDGTLTSFLFHTEADDPCATRQLAESGQAITDLRHIFVDEGADFPVDTPIDVTLTSQPLATRIPAGHRLVLTVGSAGWHTEPDPSHPTLTVTTGPDATSALNLPVVDGKLRTSD